MNKELARLNAPLHGRHVVVAILDTGVKGDHPDLQVRLIYLIFCPNNNIH